MLCLVTKRCFLFFLFLRYFLQDLKESFNYGFYCPSVGGKAGKFLDEERPLKDYPLAGPVGFLEVSCSCIRRIVLLNILDLYI